MAHLERCPRCRALVLAEGALKANFDAVAKADIPEGVSFGSIKEKVQSASRSEGSNRRLVAGLRYKYIAAVAAVIAIVAIFPFHFTEKVGYEIAIAGVDREVALDNQKIGPLLDALGMEKNKATDLLDSVRGSEIHLVVGDCRETCHLKISDLKTERDVQLVVRAIIELGCCQIDNINPIFRSQTTSLIRLAAQKLFS
jgi:hypothetical protein